MFSVRKLRLGQRVGGEVHRPPLARPAGRRQRYTLRSRQVLPAATTDLQPSGLIDPMDTLVIDHQALALEQDVQAPVAEARPHRRVCVQPG